MDLEDKVLGNKRDNYCSSSSDSEDECDKAGSVHQNGLPEPRSYAGGAVNTGPKGVLEDWREYRKLQSEKRETDERKLLELANRFSVGGKDCAERNNVDEVDAEFMQKYIQKRKEELLRSMAAKQATVFGRLFELQDAATYLELADVESANYCCIIHIYDPDNEDCVTMNHCLSCLASEFPKVKFCRVKAAVLGTSHRFRADALPALQVYRDKQLVGNFVKLTKDLGTDFYATDVEAYLKDYGFLSSPLDT